MRTAGLMMNDVWADRALRERGVEAYRYNGLPAEIGVLVDAVELKHKGKEQNYRPYLHIVGELRSITPTEPLPYGITQVTYSQGQGEKVDAYYEFDDEQLVALAGKGYFNAAFAVPEQLTGIEWELPATVDALVLTPSAQQADAPVVFMNVHRIADLEIDLESSGYDLTDYFLDHSPDDRDRPETVIDERGLRARSDAINSLFTEDELDLGDLDGQVENSQQTAQSDQHDHDATGMNARLQQVEAQIAAEREQFNAELERTEGTPQHLYHERVAQALRTDEEEASPATHKPTAHKSADQSGGHDLSRGLGHGVGEDLDFDLDAEAAPVLEERKGEVSHRSTDPTLDPTLDIDLDIDLDPSGVTFGEDNGHDLEA